MEIALLDRDGVIVEVNEAWLRFARESGGDPTRTGVGASYLAACDSASGDHDADQVAGAIRAAARGGLPAPLVLRVACDAPDQQRLFDLQVSPRISCDGGCIGAAVALSQVVVEGETSVEPAPEPRPTRRSPADDQGMPELDFPDVPRMDLERAIDQLTGHAQAVLHAQGRLRELLRANSTVAGDLSLPVVLRRSVSAARDLIGARHAALVLVGRDGASGDVIHDGMDPELVHWISSLPGGGRVDVAGRPTRLTDPEDVRAQSPPGPLPGEDALLMVPVRERSAVFGRLYLVESTRGGFTTEDQQLVTAFAFAAGTAIENARLFQQAEMNRRWLAASTEITQKLFAAATERPLDPVLRLAAQGAEADLANLALEAPEGSTSAWTVHAATGLLADAVVGQPIGAASAVQQVIESGKPLLLDDYMSHVGDDGVYGVSDAGVAIGSVVCAPLLAGEHVVGVLSVGRLAGRGSFTEADMDQLGVFAGHAGLALDLGRARVARESLDRMQDHDRIAADLHEHVISELFAVGMGMQGLVSLLPRREQQLRVLGYVDAIDSTIRRIRSTVFQLQDVRHPASSGLRATLLASLQDHIPALGFCPTVEFTGRTESIRNGLAEDVSAVVRESLVHMAAHAHATRAQIHVDAHEVVTVEVTDDGSHAAAAVPSDALTDLRHRAEVRDGRLDISSSPDGGTCLRWTARVTT
ncbi:GAF domain-containing protein [Pedococcus sp. KACC 23699]|uniref:GAF domain-containing protein n=1 Tax=Pedococcus sp. KACC 23699 TaxID=3149228 RepID=A0AAU7JQG7_9MICO